MSRSRDVLFVASWMEEPSLARLRAGAGDAIDILHDNALLAPPRYREDHVGRADFRRSAEQEAAWRAHLGRATILWDFPGKDSEGRPGVVHAPNVRWAQTTSAGVGQMVARLGEAARDIVVTTASGEHARALAEFAGAARAGEGPAAACARPAGASLGALLRRVARRPHARHRWRRQDRR
jgi:hypothetical protein